MQPYTKVYNYEQIYVCATKKKMKSHMLLSPLWKIGSWKKIFLCGEKSLEKPTLELPHEIIGSEVLPRLHATVELPCEIIEWEILPRLPAESLPKFLCVCKHWRSLILTCEFTRKNLYYITNKKSPTHRKVLEIDNIAQTFSTRDCDNLNTHDSTIVRSISFVNKAQEVLLLASFDGLVFVELFNTRDRYGLQNTGEYGFWNPLTGAYKKFSASSNSYWQFNAFGFYFDSYKKDYKVLQLTSFGAFKAFIYSRRPNSTKEIQWFENHQRLSNSVWSTPISLGEGLYFLGRDYNFRNLYQYCIIVFDVKSEKLREIPFPLLNQENAYHYGSLMVIKGCIHIFVANDIHIQETGFIDTDGELWRMDGDGDDWTKVKDFSPARNHPLTYDEKIEMEHLVRNFNLMERGRKMLYIETFVSPSD